jgi:hypothetical protein
MKNILLFLCLASITTLTHARRCRFPIFENVAVADTFGSQTDESELITAYDLDTAYLLRKFDRTSDAYRIEVSRYQLQNGRLLRRDTLSNVPKAFSPRSSVFRKGRMFLCGFSQYVSTTFSDDSMVISPEKTNQYRKSRRYDRATFLDDSTVLLYTIYNYHPADGIPGLYLYVLDLKTNTITTEKYYKFSGVALSHLYHKWVHVVGEYIYIINPLTANLTIYDRFLNVRGQLSTEALEGNILKKQQAIQVQYDEIVLSEHRRYEIMLADSAAKRATFDSRVYKKEFISNTIKRSRDSLEFVENIFSFGTKSLAIVINQPQDDKNKLLVEIDPVSGKRLCSRKWRVAPQDTIKSKNDLYVVDISPNTGSDPHLRNGNLYFHSSFPFDNNPQGTFLEYTNRIVTNIEKSGFLWAVYRYSYL